MNVQKNVSLRAYSTMRLGGTAAYLATAESRQDVASAVNWAKQQQLPIIMIGGGSNIVWRDEGFPGLVIINAIKRFEDFAEDELNHYVTVGAGESWDEVVGRCVDLGLSGIEALSLIPGTVGATPVQNVGAYGQEIADTLVSVEAYDSQTNTFLNIPHEDCTFGYRTSRFKTTDRGRFFITAITLHLVTSPPQPPFYGSVETYLNDNQITEHTSQIIRDAVIAIRSRKLPDPAEVANNGSFFANPVIDSGSSVQLLADYPGAPHWELDDGRVKFAAAWLIEQAGFKDFHDQETGMATWPTQPLVLVNEHAESTTSLLVFKQKIVDAVHEKFDIILQQEPELLP